MPALEIHSVPLATVQRLNAERTIPLDRYEEDGAIDRFGYLHGLAKDNDLAFNAVLLCADTLGPDEDFDGLVIMLEDLGFIGGGELRASTIEPTVDRTDAIARLNDRARMGLDPTARVVFTRNCLATFCDADGLSAVVVQAELMAAFRRASFGEDSPERDFASIEYRGQKVWLKIDYYDSTMEFGSEEPADASVTTRVLTILLPSDY